jgi:hypothetical protein
MTKIVAYRILLILCADEFVWKISWLSIMKFIHGSILYWHETGRISNYLNTLLQEFLRCAPASRAGCWQHWPINSLKSCKNIFIILRNYPPLIRHLVSLKKKVYHRGLRFKRGTSPISSTSSSSAKVKPRTKCSTANPTEDFRRFVSNPYYCRRVPSKWPGSLLPNSCIVTVHGHLPITCSHIQTI